MTYVKRNIHIPIWYLEWENRLKKIMREITQSLVEEKIDIVIDTSRIHNIVLNNSGENTVIPGRHRDDYGVVVKIPVFHRYITEKKIAEDAMGKYRDMSMKCINAINECSRRYPSIVGLIKVNIPIPYVVERYVPGISLRDMIRERGVVDPYQVVKVAIDIGEGPIYLHRRGIYHNDIRPENIIVELRDGYVEKYS